MKKILIAFIIINFISLVHSNDIKPRILIIPFENQVDDDIYNAICSSINSTITNSLKYMGIYEILIDQQDEHSGLSKGELHNYVIENYIDNVIYGFLNLDEKNNIVLNNSLYESKTDSLLLSKDYIAENYFDIFDISEILISEMLSRFSDEHIGFGSINFNNRGEKAAFEIYLNGSFVGNNTIHIPKVLNGTYLIEIKQNRFNQKKVIFSKEYLLKEREKLNIDFSVPYLTAYEEENIKNIAILAKNTIVNNIDIDIRLMEVKALLESMDDLSFSPTLIIEKKDIEQLLLRLEINRELNNAIENFNNKENINTSFFQISHKFLKDSENKSIAEQEFLRSVQLISVLQKLEGIKLLVKKDYEGYYSHENEVKALTFWFSKDFLNLYRNDSLYIEALYNSYLSDKKTKSKYQFVKHLKEYYGDIWDLMKQRNVKLSKGSVLEWETKFLELKPDSNFTVNIPEFDTFMWNAYVGGGSLVTASSLWNPTKRFGLKMGLSFAYYDYYSVAIPLEFNYYFFKKPFWLYAGITSDLIRYQNITSQDGLGYIIFDQDDYESNLGYVTDIGLNLGFSIPLGRIILQINNYFYPTNFLSDDADFIYSPSIGVLF
ncbi:MAG: hypothetical protein OCD02_16320 [Spirochaetaceae bacterium]